MPEGPDKFIQVEVQAGDRLLIRSTCKFCGASRLVSREDGSLQKWENGHDCSKGMITEL
jgi:hypothetical protein